MADLKISELRPLTDTQIVAADLLAVADISATETRKITALDQAKATVRLIPDGSIPYTKIDPSTVNIPDGSVVSDDLATGSVTHEKIADNAVEANNILDGAVTGSKIDPSIFNRGLDSTGGLIGITNSVFAGSHAGISYNEQGLITGVTPTIPSADLPLATDSTVGVVSVPNDGGLAVAGTGAVSINNAIAPGTSPKITYDQHGLVVGGAALEAADIPAATETAIGGVNVPTDGNLRVNDGAIRMAPSGATAGIGYTKFDCNEFGVITNASTQNSGDIPSLPADKITSGTFPAERLADGSITAPKHADYATCLMQEGNPGKGDFLGQLWFTPSTAQLRVFTRGSGPQNIWSPVGFGNLQANNLRWGGTYNAETNTIVNVTSIGTSEGLVAGDPFPVPTDGLSGLYLVCAVGGSNTTQPQLSGVTSSPGDWALCLDASQGWNHIDTSAGGGGGGGGATSLNDLVDVSLGGAAPFATGALEGGSVRSALEDRNLFKYDSSDGMWKNTNLIDCGSF